MRQRVLQAVFVAAFLLIAILIVQHGQPRLFHMPTAQAQDSPSSLTGPLRPARPSDRKAAIAAIQAQLRAFKQDDFQKATQYQSRGLRQRYGSTANFRDGIQQGYPAFIHFRGVTFGPAQTPDGGLHLGLSVTLTETGGAQVHAFYLMVRETGAYKVDGVQGGEMPPAASGAPSQQT